jgi:lysosomal acid lipase/cholesteryl ester hydrolase
MDTVTATRTFHHVLTFLIIRVLPFYILTRILINNFGMETTNEDMGVANRIREGNDFAELCQIFGYAHEEHVVTTEDGYMLTLHRILPKAVEGAKDIIRPTVYLQHGLLTSSELFVCITDANRCLPFVLIEAGYDVWLGNNRRAITPRGL